MNENKKLFVGIGTIFSIALVLVLSVYAHDHPGTIDHMFDFHLDTDRIQKELEQDIERERQEKENQEAFYQDVMSIGKDD